MDEKTVLKDPKIGKWKDAWTHANRRSAYNSLNHLWRSDLLFTYLTPPKDVLNPEGINPPQTVSKAASTPNSNC